MRQKMDNWQRIDSVIRWANMTINYFALYIGFVSYTHLTLPTILRV